MPRHAAHIGTVNRISSLLNSNAAADGFRVSNVTLQLRITSRRFGQWMKEMHWQSYAERADVSFRYLNISSAGRYVQRARVHLIQAAPTIISFISKWRLNSLGIE